MRGVASTMPMATLRSTHIHRAGVIQVSGAALYCNNTGCDRLAVNGIVGERETPREREQRKILANRSHINAPATTDRLQIQKCTHIPDTRHRREDSNKGRREKTERKPSHSAHCYSLLPYPEVPGTSLLLLDASSLLSLSLDLTELRVSDILVLVLVI